MMSSTPECKNCGDYVHYGLCLCDECSTMQTNDLAALRTENERLQRERDALRGILETINTWCGTDAGYQALPFEPPWYQQLHAALSSKEG